MLAGKITTYIATGSQNSIHFIHVFSMVANLTRRANPAFQAQLLEHYHYIMFPSKSHIMTFNEMIQSEKPVLVDFFATWCGPCKMMAPILTDVKKELGDAASIIKVDIDKNPAAANAFQVQGVPTFILFKKGKTLWRQSGILPKSSLLEVIRKHVG